MTRGHAINARATAGARLTEAWDALHKAKTQQTRDAATLELRRAEDAYQRACDTEASFTSLAPSLDTDPPPEAA